MKGREKNEVWKKEKKKGGCKDAGGCIRREVLNKN